MAKQRQNTAAHGGSRIANRTGTRRGSKQQLDQQTGRPTQRLPLETKTNELRIEEYPKLPKHAILHFLRGYVEQKHREAIMRQTGRFMGPPCVSLESVPRMRSLEIESCCNKSVPIYLLPDASSTRCEYQLLLAVLHNYLYRTWFRPYRSEIDWAQFLAQVITISSTPAPPPTETPADAARFAATLSRAICAHVETVGQKVGARASGVIPHEEVRALQKELGFGDWEPIHDRKFLLLQPLFRAVAVVIRRRDYGIHVPAISEMPVLLVLTGAEEGLSAPITFESIKHKVRAHHEVGDSIQVAETSLATAVSFVMDLEKREVAAFGPKPDPAETCKLPRRSCLLDEDEALFWARKYGWEGDEAPEGPSSSWVDTSIYQEWTGDGADWDAKAGEGWERQCRRAVEKSPNIYAL